ncbi:hypothetical protein XNC3_3050002 [Xenorhabdus nematophila F1]|nr:hypothetical protein XNC3_3050002 [Xenorhabdus nematophila F1]
MSSAQCKTAVWKKAKKRCTPLTGLYSLREKEGFTLPSAVLARRYRRTGASTALSGPEQKRSGTAKL